MPTCGYLTQYLLTLQAQKLSRMGALKSFYSRVSPLDTRPAQGNSCIDGKEPVVGHALIELSARSHERICAPRHGHCCSANNPSSGKDSDVWQGKCKLPQSRRFVSPHRQLSRLRGLEGVTLRN